MYLKELVDSGRYGRLKRLSLRRLSPRPMWAWDNWLHDVKRSGSAVLDLHIHDVDFARYLLGDPIRVKAVMGLTEGRPEHVHAIYEYPGSVKADAAVDAEVEDAVATPSQTVVSLEGGWDFPQGFPFEMAYRADFDGAIVAFSSATTPSLHIYTTEGETFDPEIKPTFYQDNTYQGGNLSNLGGYYNELRYFIDALTQRKPVVVAPLIEGIRSARLVWREVREAI
jgi:predicted dehydrogenase